MILLPLLLIALGAAFVLTPLTLIDLLAGLISVVGNVLNFLMIPINLLIKAVIPQFNDAMASIVDMLDVAATYMFFILDASMIPPAAITLMAAYLLFAPALTLSLWLFKLPLKWKRSLLG